MSHDLFSYPTGVVANNTYNGTVGNQYTVSDTVTVSALSAFLGANLGSGWTSSKTITLWNQSTGAVLATATIPANGSGASLVGQFWRIAITPVNVPSGTLCVLGGSNFGTDGFQVPSTAGTGVALTTDTASGAITLTGSGLFIGSANTMPTNSGGEPNPAAYGAASMVYTVTGGGSPTLSCSPTSGTVVDSSTTFSTTPTLSNSSATLTVSVAATGGGAAAGTINSTSATSGTATVYTPPTNGSSGSDTITFHDTTDGLTATSVVAYGPASLVALPITVVSQDSTGMVLQGNVTGSYTSIQWQQCATQDGTFSNTSGATSAEQKYTVAPGGAPLYVQCVFTGPHNTVASYGSGSSTPFAVVPCPDPLLPVLCSDSTGTTAERFDQTTFTQVLTDGWLPGSCTVNNQSISGTTVQGWDSTYTAEVIAGLSAGKYVIVIPLGVNDSKYAGNNSGETTLLSAADWSTHMASICSQFLSASKLAGSRIVLLGTGYVQPGAYSQWNDASVALLLQYNAAIPTLCNGTTILDGSTHQRYYTFAANQSLYQDGVHETTAGGTILAMQYAVSVLAALRSASTYPVESTVESGTVYGIDAVFTGTFAGGGSYPTTSEIATAVVAEMADAPVGSVVALNPIAFNQGTVSASPAPTLVGTIATFWATGTLNLGANVYTSKNMRIRWQTGGNIGLDDTIVADPAPSSGSAKQFTTSTTAVAISDGDTFVIY